LNEKQKQRQQFDHLMFFQALQPLQEVILKGISPQPIPTTMTTVISLSCWEHLTYEYCDLTNLASSSSSSDLSWISYCIPTLEELVLMNCTMTQDIIQNLSDAYLTYSTQQQQQQQQQQQKSQHRKRSSSKKIKVRKNPLQVLDLSDNTSWLNETTKDENDGTTVNDSSDNNVDHGIMMMVSSQQNKPPSCMASFLASSWMDSLSNLVELNLSYNSKLFIGDHKAMADLCTTVNQSLKRLSLRHCHLSPFDLHLLVSTFCWIKAIALSENPELLDDLSPLLYLENLKEVILENMSSDDDDNNVGKTNDKTKSNKLNEQGFAYFLYAIQDVHGEGKENDYNDCSRGFISVKKQQQIESLNLSGNNLDEDTLAALSCCDFLKVLILVGCQLQSEGLITLLGKHKEEGRSHLFWKRLKSLLLGIYAAGG
jgi:hypothetical protein